MKAASILRSSMYLRFSMFGLVISGLKRAPLKIMINKRMPRYTPWGEDPGSIFHEEDSQFYLLLNIDLSVK